MGSKEPRTLIPFGPFEAELPSQELRKQGVRLRLPKQSFQILIILLEHPGKLVSREELRQALWPAGTFVDFEHGLNAAVNRLREALGDDAESPRYIETLPRRGYRYVGPVPPVAPSKVAPLTSSEEALPPAKATNLKPWLGGIALTALCIAGAAGLYPLRSPLRPPQILHYRQLTSDRHGKGETPCGFESRLVTDGPRVFYSEPSASIMQVSSGGGDAVAVPTPFGCFRIIDISPDKTEILGVSQTSGFAFDQPLWSLSVVTGQVRRVGNISTHAAGWSPDGRTIAYATGNDLVGASDLYLAAKDGSDSRKILRIEKGFIERIRWSAASKVLRMVVSGRLWEVSVGGTNLHPLPQFAKENRDLNWINWTPGGKYFLFNASRADSFGADIWALREAKSLSQKDANTPVQLTSGPMTFWNPAPSPDGKQIFAIGGQFRGELSRYDLKSHKLEPYLSGISAEHLDFSKDGKYLAYVTFPEGVLWRSKMDGSERMQLTSAPLYAGLPHWSPDGSRISFSGQLSGGTWSIYVISAEGGKPELVSQSQSDELDPTWSADGNSLIFGGGLGSADTKILTVDLSTKRVSVIPGSDGLFSPRSSPNGRFIVAIDAPGNRKLMLFDQNTQKWLELLTTQNPGMSWPVWSRDNKLVYFTDLWDKHRPVLYRIRIADRKLERLEAFDVPQGITGYWISWAGIAPDESPLVLRDLSIQEIYALDVDLP